MPAFDRGWCPFPSCPCGKYQKGDHAGRQAGRPSPVPPPSRPSFRPNPPRHESKAHGLGAFELRVGRSAFQVDVQGPHTTPSKWLPKRHNGVVSGGVAAGATPNSPTYLGKKEKGGHQSTPLASTNPAAPRWETRPAQRPAHTRFWRVATTNNSLGRRQTPAARRPFGDVRTPWRGHGSSGQLPECVQMVPQGSIGWEARVQGADKWAGRCSFGCGPMI